MNTPISEQIKAIQQARRMLAEAITNAGDMDNARILDAKLNDAGSSLAALNLNPDHFERDMKQGEDEAASIGARDEYFDQLENLWADYFEEMNPNASQKLTERILSISYDRVVELENKVQALEVAIQISRPK